MTTSSAVSSAVSFSRCRFPGEYSKHAACLLLYPHRAETFILPLARKEFASLVRAIVEEGNEDVVVFFDGASEAGGCVDAFKGDVLALGSAESGEEVLRRVGVAVCDSDDTWARDTGPSFLVDKEGGALVPIDWDFNAYGGSEGGCYWPCDRDRKVCGSMCKALSAAGGLKPPLPRLPPVGPPASTPGFVLEGGSFHCDGEGTCITTEECLLNANRNPALSKEDIQERLMLYLNVAKVIWLPRGLFGDEDTNGHVDNFACFVAPAHICLAWSDDPGDPQHEISAEALSVLDRSTDAKGRPFKVTKVHVPSVPLHLTAEECSQLKPSETFVERKAGEVRVDHRSSSSSSSSSSSLLLLLPRSHPHRLSLSLPSPLSHPLQRLAASYINFYFSNEAVIVPTFGDPNDRAAIDTLKRVCPDRKVVGVYTRNILIGGGNIHCQTQQVPAL